MKTALNRGVVEVATLLFLFVAHTAPVHGQITPVNPTPIFPSLNPPSPDVIGPVGVNAVTQSQTKSITVSWFQSVVSVTQPPRSAAYFVVCLQDGSLPCVYGANATGVWNSPVVGGSFARSPVYSGTPFTTTPRILRGYNYSFQTTLDNTFYNRFLKLSVGACASQLPGSCSFDDVSVQFSSVDLTAHNIGNHSNTMTEEHFFGQAGNIGSGMSGSFIGALEIVKVELTQAPAPFFCLTDPNQPGLGLDDQDQLIVWTGDRIRVGSRRTSTGAIDVTGLAIIGVRRTYSDTAPVYYQRGNLITLNANDTAGAVGLNLPIVRPVAYVVELRIDAAGLVPDYDRTNNRRAECVVIQ